MSTTIYFHTCLQCGDDFKNNTKNQNTCGGRCARILGRKERLGF